MRSYKLLRLLYGLHLSIFTYILFSIFYVSVLFVELDYKVFLMCILSVYMFMYMGTKNIKKKKLILAVPMLISLVLTFLLYKSHWFLYYLPNLITLILLSYKDLENISPDYLNYNMKKEIFAMLCAGIILVFLNESYTSYILRFYIFYFVIGIWMLRSSRRFQYRINSTKSMVHDVILMVSILVLSMDFFYKTLVKGVKLIYEAMTYLFEKALYLFLYLIKGGIDWILYKVNLSSKGLNAEAMKGNSKDFEFKEILVQSHPFIALVVKILFLLFIIFIIYKAFKNFRISRLPHIEGVEEQREKILKEEIKKRRIFKIKDFIKNLTSPKEPRAKVFYYFKKMQIYGAQKSVYRIYMTASQFMKILKAKGNLAEMDAKAISDIYNKAKYSSHEINEDQGYFIEESYKNIKKNYKDE